MAATSKKPIPEFRTEDEEREFWSTHDSTDYIDWRSAEPLTRWPNLEPTPSTSFPQLRTTKPLRQSN